MRGPVTAPKFVRLGVRYADHDQLDFGRSNTLLIEKLKDDLLVGFSLRVQRAEIIAGFLIAEGPHREIRLDSPLDQTLDRNVTIAEPGCLNLRSHYPAADN